MNMQFYAILRKLVVKNNIRINQEELKLQLLSHPSYPSLHALTGVLSHFNINNLALRLPVDKATLEQLPPCFIANVKKEHVTHLVLVEQQDSSIKITFDNNEKEQLSQQGFLDIWDGIILAIEKDENIKEANNAFAKNTARAFYLFAALLLIYFIYINPDWFSKTHFILSLLGLLLGGLIVKHELGLQSATTNRFCNLSEKTSCDAVLDSKGASLFGWLKLSDMSIVSFAFYTLCWLLFYVNAVSNYTPIFIATLLAIPVVIYSLYYQAYAIKMWCPLCLGIAGTLLLQAATLPFGNFSLSALYFDLQSCLLTGFSFLFVAGIWSLLKPLLEKKIQLEKIQIDHYKFKRNYTLFKALFQQEESLKTNIEIPGEIILGNPRAPIALLLVTSPMCYFCRQAHKDMEQLLRKAGDKIRLIIRFNVLTADKTNVAYRTTTQLLEIYNTKDETTCRVVLDEVYDDNIDFEKWLSKQNMVSTSGYHDLLNKQRDWCVGNNINFTPALYVNGKLFPKEYERADLLYFLDDLIEEQEKIQQNLNENMLTL